MKQEVKNLLKVKARDDLFTDARYQVVKETMQYGMKKDAWLKNYLSLDPLNKANWIADHIIIFQTKEQFNPLLN